MNRRSGSMARLAFLPIAAMAALLAVAWSTSFQGAPDAQAVDGASLSISKTCSPEAPVGGLVQYTFVLTNTGSVALDQDSVVDVPNLGDISANFPAHLEPGESAAATKFYFVQENDDRPLENTVAATYHVAGDTAVVVAEDTCSVNVPHLTITKTATFSDTSTTFTFTLTNDGNGLLIRFRVVDDVLGDISSLFPLVLAEGQTVVREKTVEGLECKDTVKVAYQSKSGFAVVDEDTCTPPERGSIHLTKVKEVGPFTIPTLVCFLLLFDGAPSTDPPEGAEQCKVPDANGEAMFWWTNLRFGNYEVVETREVCEVQGVEEDPCTRYPLLPPIPVTVVDTTPVELGEFSNSLQPGELCILKVDKDGDPWPGPDVKFTITSLTDPAFTPIMVFIPKDGNPVCFTVPEGTYRVEEEVPANTTVEPSPVQDVDVLSTATFEVVFKNIPTGDEGCTPGFWKNHLELWSATGFSTGDDFDTVFGVDLFDPDITLEQAINAKGGGVNKLARHGTAGLLSAAHPDVAYPFTVAEVIALVQAGDADALAAANELGCPLD